MRNGLLDIVLHLYVISCDIPLTVTYLFAVLPFSYISVCRVELRRHSHVYQSTLSLKTVQGLVVAQNLLRNTLTKRCKTGWMKSSLTLTRSDGMASKEP
jgi:hypothetical protein